MEEKRRIPMTQKDVPEILRFALDDNMLWIVYFKEISLMIGQQVCAPVT